jgi:hypothetical protein
LVLVELWSCSYWSYGVGPTGVMELVLLELWSWSYSFQRLRNVTFNTWRNSRLAPVQHRFVPSLLTPSVFGKQIFVNIKINNFRGSYFSTCIRFFQVPHASAVSVTVDFGVSDCPTVRLSDCPLATFRLNPVT